MCDNYCLNSVSFFNPVSACVNVLFTCIELDFYKKGCSFLIHIFDIPYVFSNYQSNNSNNFKRRFTT